VSIHSFFRQLETSRNLKHFITPKKVTIAVLIVLMIASTLSCRYAYAIAGGAVDLIGIGYIPIWFILANLSVFPGVVGTVIAFSQSEQDWCYGREARWRNAAFIVATATLGLWLLPCYDPSIMHPTAGPMSMPSLFTPLLVVLVLGSWLIFLVLAFRDLIRRDF